MTERNTKKRFSDHEVPHLFDSTENKEETKSNDESYHLIISNKSNIEEHSDTTFDKVIAKIVKERTNNNNKNNNESSILEPLKKGSTLISETPLKLPNNFIECWANTGYLPYQKVLENIEIVDKDSLNEKSFYNTCNRILSINKSNSKDLINNNSSICSSVDTAAYILSNTNVKKNGETISTVVNNKSSVKTLNKNIICKDDMSLKKNDTRNIEINSNVSTLNIRDSNINRVNEKMSEERNITKELNSIRINSTNFHNSKYSRQKKLYSSRDSPTDIVMEQFKENDDNITKMNLHPALRDSPPLEENQLNDLIQKKKKKRQKISLNHFMIKSLDTNVYNDNGNLEEDTRTMDKSIHFIDLENNLTSSQNLLSTNRMSLSCNALKEQIKRFSNFDFTSIRKIRRGKFEKKSNNKTKSSNTVDNLYLQDKFNPNVILERLSEETIKYYTRNRLSLTPLEELKESNEINDKNISNNNDLDTCSNHSSVRIIFNTLTDTPSVVTTVPSQKKSQPVTYDEHGSQSVHSDNTVLNSINSSLSTVRLWNSNNELNYSDYLGSDCSTVILNTVQVLDDKNSEKNQSDKDTEQNQSDKETEQNQSYEETEQNQSDKETEQNQSDKETEQNQSDKETEQNQSDKETEQNQSDKETEQNQSDKDTKQNQLDECTEQNQQLNNDTKQNQLDESTEQNQLDNVTNKCLDVDMDLNKKLDEDLNKDLDDKKLKYIQPVIVLNKIKLDNIENNSNDIRKSLRPRIKRVKYMERLRNLNDPEKVKGIDKRKERFSTRVSTHMTRLYYKTLTNTNLIQMSSSTVNLITSKELRNLKTNLTASTEERLNKLINLDKKLFMKPIVKLKRLSRTYYNVKNFNKNKDEEYKNSRKIVKVPIKNKKYKKKLKKKNSLSSYNLNSSTTTNPNKRKITKTRSERNKLQLPMFYTRDSSSDISYNSDSESELKSDMNLSINTPFIRCLFNISDKKQYRKINKTINSDDNTAIQSNVVFPNRTDMNIANENISNSGKTFSFSPFISMSNNTNVKNIQINITCSNGNKQCDTTQLKRVRKISSRKNNINQRETKMLIVDEKNCIPRRTFSTKTYDTDSDSTESE